MKTALTAVVASLAAMALPASAETLRWASAGDALTLDPHSQNEGQTHTIRHQMYEALIIRDVTGAFEPALALKRTDGPAVRAPLAWPMLAFVGLSFLSGVLSGAGQAMKTGLSDGLPMLVYLVGLNVLRRPEDLLRAGRIVVVGGGLAAVYGLAPSLLESSGLRIQGSLSHYYTFSGVVMLAMVVGMAHLLYEREPRARLLCGLSTAIMGVALLFTQTRSAWLAVALGAVILVASRARRLLLALPLVALLAYLLAPLRVQERVHSFFDLGDATANERVVMWETGWRMWQDAPVFGIGGRQVDEVYGEYRDPDAPFTDSPIPGHLHNNVVNLGVERGALGLAAWLAFWVGWFVLTLRTARRLGREPPGVAGPRMATLAALAALAAFQLMGLFEYNAGDSEVAALAMFLMGWPMAAEGMETDEPHHPEG